MKKTVDARLLIGGRWIESESGDRFPVVNPADGSEAGTAADAAVEDVAAAIDAASSALPGWGRTTAAERGNVMRRVAATIRERLENIARTMTAEQGKPLAESRGEVEYAASFFDWFAGEGERAYGRVVPATDPANRILVVPQPAGVVAAITPWNFPAALLARKLAPAMAAGCTSVIKPAQATPLTAALLLEAVTDAGTPAGVANLVTARRAGPVSETIFGDRRVRKVSFTGSTEVGKHLIGLSANQVKKLSLELGGHAPYIVFADADLPGAVRGILASKFRNAGQTCVCANRIYVQREIYPEVLRLLAEGVEALRVGHGDVPGVEIGPLIDAAGVAKAREHVEDAVQKGARLLVGGTELAGRDFAGGSFFAPTLLSDVTPEMLISREETFGPVAAVSVFDTEEEAIELANDSEYGLSAYFHTRDYARLLRVAERLDYGVVGANAGIISAANVPFGGVKESGYGREGGFLGIEEYLEHKYILIADVDPS
ncbi:MAG TPA: NAD-dependent succinate-semialdehyde dehydrogenase [Pseudolysinimonas sp.]|jgi:succinate-semialdehyde dehydrogenase/glutarate-semialdehyde dehydrogenase|nr:NAD-dependent succinate-semialdehyde dehydrogenase [Pseudolysinimonas sp.]